jgi:hypothetical protein
MENLVAGDLTIEAKHASPDAPIRVTWRGKSTDRQPGKILGPYFSTILTEAATHKVPIEMHFEDLDHLNSSTIASIIQVIQEARGKAVRLVVVCDQARKWQKLSFDALRVFVTGDGLLEITHVQR